MLFSLSHSVFSSKDNIYCTTIEETNPEGKESKTLILYFEDHKLIACLFTQTDSLGRFITNELHRTFGLRESLDSSLCPNCLVVPPSRLPLKAQQFLASFEFYQKKGVRA